MNKLSPPCHKTKVTPADAVSGRHRASSDRADEGIAVAQDRQADGIQTRRRCRENLRRLKGENQLPKVVRGVRFQNGVEVIEMPANHAA